MFSKAQDELNTTIRVLAEKFGDILPEGSVHLQSEYKRWSVEEYTCKSTTNSNPG